MQAPIALAVRIVNLTGEPPKASVEITCINCGTKRVVKYSKSKEKYCNRRCYREYMAGRFDRWIANPENIALPQGYDEFLSREELPCLVSGCSWAGKNLGNHVNFSHGISAEEFKRAAGFNVSTGLVTPAISQILSERPHIHENPFGGKRGVLDESIIRPVPVVRGYKSLEGSEHYAKGRALMVAQSDLPPRVCVNCGVEYKPGPIAFLQKYCSVECRSDWYRKNKPRYWMQCGWCGKDFNGTTYQKQRGIDRGLPVFCSVHCRQLHNSNTAVAKAYRERKRARGAG